MSTASLAVTTAPKRSPFYRPPATPVARAIRRTEGGGVTLVAERAVSVVRPDVARADWMEASKRYEARRLKGLIDQAQSAIDSVRSAHKDQDAREVARAEVRELDKRIAASSCDSESMVLLRLKWKTSPFVRYLILRAERSDEEALRPARVVELILEYVSTARGLPQELIRGRSKSGPVVRARQELLWLIRRHTRLSLPQIGGLMGIDHSTVLHATRRHEARILDGSIEDLGVI